MERYPRLTRSQVLERLRALAAKHGFVSNELLHAHDKILIRSIPLHFVGVAAAREAAGVPGPSYRKPRSRTGPKPGTIVGRRTRIWSKQRVIDVLREMNRAGKSTSLGYIEQVGLWSLVGAAHQYAGGLRRARELAGIAQPKPRRSKPRYDEARVVKEIKARDRAGQSLVSTAAPLRLVKSGRWQFGTWSKALRAAGVDPEKGRAPARRTMYTREYIISRLRQEAKAGSDLRGLTLAKVIKLEFLRRVFGTLRAALHAAGLGGYLQRRKHGLQKWNRERVIEVLQERAARKVYTLTPGLHRVVQLYFGGAEHARAAARVPSPLDIRRLRHKAPSAISEPRRNRGRTRPNAGSRRRVIDRGT